MVDKNPYEKDDVNVPNFGNQETTGNNPIFNMDTTSIPQETDSFDAEAEAESSSKTAIIILVVFLILFLAGTISGWVYGISKAKETTTITNDFNSYKVDAQKQITELESTVSSLKLQLDAGSSEGSQVVTVDPSTGEAVATSSQYTITSDSGLKVRPSAGATGSSYADYSKLKDTVKKVVSDNGGSLTIAKGFKVTVLKTETVNDQVWGQIDDAAWICLKNGSEEYATNK